MDDYINIFSLKKKKAVITGAAGVLCSSIAMGLGRAGAELAICDIKDTKKIISMLRKNNIKANGYYIDATDIDEVRKCKGKVINDFGKIDILVNGVGGNMKQATASKELSFFNIPEDALEKVLKLNLYSTIYCSQVFGEVIAKNKSGGSIINISSMNSYRPLTGIAGYSAAKAAVSNFTKWLAVHLAIEYNKNIRVNAIAPGFFLTEQLKYLHFDSEGKPTDRAKKTLELTPMGRYGKPEELIGTCIWLASDSSRFVTGTITPVDGGFNAYSGV